MVYHRPKNLTILSRDEKVGLVGPDKQTNIQNQRLTVTSKELLVYRRVYINTLYAMDMMGFHKSVSHSRFSPTPADLMLSRRQLTHIRQAAEKITSHRQPKDPSATGIPLNLKFKKAVSCRKMG